jgi:hypothetical protein
VPPKGAQYYAWSFSPNRVEIVSQLTQSTTIEPAGIRFLVVHAEENYMLGQGLSLLKTLIKSSLDNYVLPGTLTGTEILFIYMKQWKRDALLLTSATRQLITADPDRTDRTGIPAEQQNESIAGD